MKKIHEPKITPVLLDEFKQALAGGRGDLDAWLEVNDEAEVRAFVLAIQKQAYEDGLRDAADKCEKERLEFVEKAARNDGRHSDMAFGSINSAERIMKEIYAMLTASKKEPQ